MLKWLTFLGPTHTGKQQTTRTKYILTVKIKGTIDKECCRDLVFGGLLTAVVLS